MSEKNAGTPGPWRVCRTFIVAPGREDAIVATVASGDDSHDRRSAAVGAAEADANAALIALAPEMRDALEECRGTIAHYCPGTDLLDKVTKILARCGGA